MDAHIPLPAATAAALPGKYLAFTLGRESYAVPVLAVREIIRLCPITPVASMPAHVRGVINLRGRVIPVVDLRIRFGLTDVVDHDRACIVVMQVGAAVGGSRPYGVIVDGVDEVAAYAADDLVPPPDFGTAIDTRFMTGMARRGAGVTTLLDLEAIARADREPA
ncbi:MAG: chemotaxis protein CheW [Planctomycetia bacterium]|jgi:purine-binding chemotaxis protein CheW